MKEIAFKQRLTTGGIWGALLIIASPLVAFLIIESARQGLGWRPSSADYGRLQSTIYITLGGLAWVQMIGGVMLFTGREYVYRYMPKTAADDTNKPA